MRRTSEWGVGVEAFTRSEVLLLHANATPLSHRHNGDNYKLGDYCRKHSWEVACDGSRLEQLHPTIDEVATDGESGNTESEFHDVPHSSSSSSLKTP